ncbi:thiol-disulfide oxidoreductase DCC family protein, partial [Pyxidicoccus sp. 3LFB2]
MSETKKAPEQGAAVVLFDGVCNLCNGAVNFIIDRDPAARFRFAALQSRSSSS